MCPLKSVSYTHLDVYKRQVQQELDLKKAAKSVKEKSIAMLKAKDLLPLTGYVHGGCSPIGMKKEYPTVIDNEAKKFETIVFSAGKIGCSVELKLEHLQGVIKYILADVIE